MRGGHKKAPCAVLPLQAKRAFPKSEKRKEMLSIRQSGQNFAERGAFNPDMTISGGPFGGSATNARYSIRPRKVEYRAAVRTLGRSNSLP